MSWVFFSLSPPHAAALPSERQHCTSSAPSLLHDVLLPVEGPSDFDEERGDATPTASNRPPQAETNEADEDTDPEASDFDEARGDATPTASLRPSQAETNEYDDDTDPDMPKIFDSERVSKTNAGSTLAAMLEICQAAAERNQAAANRHQQQVYLQMAQMQQTPRKQIEASEQLQQTLRKHIEASEWEYEADADAAEEKGEKRRKVHVEKEEERDVGVEEASSWTQLRQPAESPGDGYEWEYEADTDAAEEKGWKRRKVQVEKEEERYVGVEEAVVSEEKKVKKEATTEEVQVEKDEWRDVDVALDFLAVAGVAGKEKKNKKESRKREAAAEGTVVKEEKEKVKREEADELVALKEEKSEESEDRV